MSVPSPQNQLSQERFSLIFSMHQSGVLKFAPIEIENNRTVGGGFCIGEGRFSPYEIFPKAANIPSMMQAIGDRMARVIQRLEIPFDMVIAPDASFSHLAVATVLSMCQIYHKEVAFGGVAKQMLQEGEVVSAFLANKSVVIVTDTAIGGALIEDTIALLQENKAFIVAVVQLWDRKEIIDRTCRLSVHQNLKLREIPTKCVFDAQDIEHFLADDRFVHKDKEAILKSMKAYLGIWGEVKDLSKGNRGGVKAAPSRILSTDNVVTVGSTSPTKRSASDDILTETKKKTIIIAHLT